MNLLTIRMKHATFPYSSVSKQFNTSIVHTLTFLVTLISLMRTVYNVRPVVNCYSPVPALAACNCSFIWLIDIGCAMPSSQRIHSAHTNLLHILMTLLTISVENERLAVNCYSPVPALAACNCSFVWPVLIDHLMSLQHEITARGRLISSMQYILCVFVKSSPLVMTLLMTCIESEQPAVDCYSHVPALAACNCSFVCLMVIGRLSTSTSGRLLILLFMVIHCGGGVFCNTKYCKYSY